MPRSEIEIVAAIRNGDMELLEEVMNTYSGLLLKMAYTMVNDRKLAEDIVQETFIKFYYAIDRFRCEASIKTYLSRILLNQCRQKMRKNWFRKVFAAGRGEELRRQERDLVEEASERMDLLRNLQKLDVKYREVILLHYYYDLSIKEIARVLKQPEGTVKSKLKRARDQLKKISGEELFYEQQEVF